MNIDDRIKVIMEKMGKLSLKHPEFSCGEFPPRWDEPLTEKVVAEYEKENGIILPEDYRRFITTVAGSGTQPFYGLYSPIGELPDYEFRAGIIGHLRIFGVLAEVMPGNWKDRDCAPWEILPSVL